MLKEEKKDNKRFVFGFVLYIINPITFKLKNKGFNIDLIINSLITLLLTFSLYNNHLFYIHLITFLSFKILILLITFNSSYNK